MIKRVVFDRLIAAHPELKFSAVHTLTNETPTDDHLYALFECAIDPQSGVYLSEDYAFCARWRALGGEIWLDLHSRLTHAGMSYYEGDCARRYAALNAAPIGRDGGAAQRRRRLSRQGCERTAQAGTRPAYARRFLRPQNFSFLSRSAALSLVIASVGTVTVSGTDSAQSSRIFLARSSDSAAPVG